MQTKTLIPRANGLKPAPPLRRAGFTAALACLFLLGACGLQVGTADYVSERNSAPRGRPAFKAPGGGGETLAGLPEGAIRMYPPGSGQSVVSTARSVTGTPYRSGGTTPQRGFDCSGLIYWAYRQQGITVPRIAREQAGFGHKVHAGALKPGDIVAFRISSGYHTGIYTGGGKFIHSPRTGAKVREENLNTNYWSSRFLGGRRVL